MIFKFPLSCKGGGIVMAHEQVYHAKFVLLFVHTMMVVVFLKGISRKIAHLQLL